MSFDILIFDPDSAPETDEEFKEWSQSLAQHDHHENRSDPMTCSPALQNFFQHLSKKFPPTRPSGAVVQSPVAGSSFLAKLAKRLVIPKKSPDNINQSPNNINHVGEDFDEACFTEYNFSAATIYLSFRWSVAQHALQATLDAALKSRVGVYNVSASDPRPIRKKQDLIASKSQIIPAPPPKLTKADVFRMLKDNGWVVKRDPIDGSRSATRIEGDRVYGLLPDVRNRPDGTRINWREDVAPMNYLRAISKIDDRSHVFYPFLFKRGTQQEDQHLTIAHARLEVEHILGRLRNEDLESALKDTASLPFTSPGNAPLRLLAAKACNAEYAELCEMRDKMKSGDRQGFVPYIETAHLERAVEACQLLKDAPN